MATKFGYVERNLENDVNWANVGKGFSDMLLAERDERKAKKVALDDAMQQTQEGLRKNAPLGYNTDFNDRMIGLAANSNAFVLAANKDLKAGRITPEEYMRKLHRVNSSADTTFALANNYNAIYEDKLKRMDDKDSGNVEQAAFEAMSKLVDFNKHDFMIDENGTIVAAPLITDENGITSLDTKNARSVQAIFNLAQNTVNRFDVEGNVAESVARLGKRVLGTSVAATYGKQGMDVLIEGIKAADKPAYDEWKKQTTKKIMADKFDVASILTDFSDEYETTTDKKKWLANKDKYVYVDIENGKEILIGELTDEQNAKAIDILDGVIESQVGSSRKEKATSILRPDATQRAEWKAGNATAKMKKDAITMLGYLYAGKNQADIDSALNYFEGLNENISKISRTPDKITLTIRDPKTKELTTSTIPMKSGEDVVSFEMFVKGATQLTQKEDVSSALKYIDKKKLKTDPKTGAYVFNADVETSKSRTYEDQPTVNEGFDKRVNRLFLEVSDVNEIQQILQTSGIESLNEDGKIIIGKETKRSEDDDTETVIKPGITYDITNEKDKAKLKQFIKNNIKTKEQRETFYSTPGDGELD